MNCYSDKGWWNLELNEAEARILADSFSELKALYQMSPDQLPEAVNRCWRGRITRNDLNEMNLTEEQRELDEERLAWRAMRLKTVEMWQGTYRLGEKWRLEVSPDDIETLISIINDRRLALAGQFSLDEADMENDPQTELNEVKKHALWEIHFLAFFQENIVLAIRNGNANFDL